MPSVPDGKHNVSDPSNFAPDLPSSKDGKSDPSDPSNGLSVLVPPLAIKESLARVSSGGADIVTATFTTGDMTHVVGQDLSIESTAVISTDSSHTLLLPSFPTPDLPLINGKSTIRIPDGALVFAGSKIAPGSQATIYGHIISVEIL